MLRTLLRALLKFFGIGTFPKKVFHLRKRQKAYTYDLKLEIQARAVRFAARNPARTEVEQEARRLRQELARTGWREAVTPLIGRPFLDVAESYFKNLVKELVKARVKARRVNRVRS